MFFLGTCNLVSREERMNAKLQLAGKRIASREGGWRMWLAFYAGEDNTSYPAG